MSKNRGSQLDSFLGDAKQIPRALYYLIDGAYKVCIEKEDDVSVIDKDEQVLIAEQLKDKTENVFADHSEDFWNTLYNWVVDWRDGHSNFTDDTKFILFSNNKSTKMGVFTSKCHNAKSENEVKEAWKYITENFDSSTEKIIGYFNEIKKSNNRKILSKIIRNFQCKQPQSSIKDDLEQLISKNYLKAFDKDIESFKDALYRWFHDKIYDENTKKIKLCMICKDELNEFHSIHAGREITLSLVGKDDIPYCLFESTRNSLFIKQHNIIGQEDQIIEAAHRDFLAWDILKDKERNEGRVTEEQFNNAYQDMYEIWVENKSDIYNMHAEKPENVKAQQLYLKCLKEIVKVGGVEFDCTPKRVSRGIYNQLANEDLSSYLSIGWHSDYKKLLSTKEETND